MKRWLSALVGIPLVCVILILGNDYIISGVIGMIALIALHEYFSAFKEIANPISWIGYVSCAFVFLLPWLKQEMLGNVFEIILASVLFLLFVIKLFGKKNRDIKDIAITLLGIVYIVFTISFVPRIYHIEKGNILIWLFFLAIWGTDAFAYIIGKHFGKHHFTDISPKKTIEGSIGGAIGAVITNVIFTLICHFCFSVELSYLYVIGISIALSVIGQIGDLAASSIKRYTNKKDFGKLIPGHGGMLDRFDSILLAAPIAFWLLQLL